MNEFEDEKIEEKIRAERKWIDMIMATALVLLVVVNYFFVKINNAILHSFLGLLLYAFILYSNQTSWFLTKKHNVIIVFFANFLISSTVTAVAIAVYLSFFINIEHGVPYIHYFFIIMCVLVYFASNYIFKTVIKRL